MFRNEKKQNGQQTANEMHNQKPSSSWQHSAAPVEPAAMPAAPAQPRAIGESDSMARDIKEGVLNGFIGNGTVMSGEAEFRGMLRVDGQLTGRISSEDGTLLVGSNGQVDANIRVSVATIHGTVNGDIVATKRIEMGRSAKVVGNIQTPALVIEQGAIFEGGCRMLESSAMDESRKEPVAEAKALVVPSRELAAVPTVSRIAN